MWTVGYINHIEAETAYITYSHVDEEVPYLFKPNERSEFQSNQIIFILLDEKIINGIQYDKIIDIQAFDNK